MKKFFLPAILALSAYAPTLAQRCEIALNLTTQYSIDTISAATKSCAVQYLYVSGADITNLDGLSGFDLIYGGLQISNNPNLLNISGLSTLKNVGDLIQIDNNPLITNLDGLQSLTRVSGYLRIKDNPALTSISALKNLKSVGGFLDIGRNATLASLTGLENIEWVGDGVFITSNPMLTDLSPFSKLWRIVGHLNIAGNPSLTSLAGLINLREVWGNINIDNNDALTSLYGLNNIDPDSPWSLNVANSQALSFCAVKSACMLISKADGSDFAKFENNAPGCSSATEVNQSCASLPVELVSFSGSNSREGNILNWETALEINNAGFELQKSRDARSFEVVGFVTGEGNTKENHRYEYWDHSPSPLTYYRLKQTDLDGTYSYSKLVAVKDNFAPFRKNTEAVAIYPNPVRDQLTIRLKNQDQPYSIYNLEGKVLKAGDSVPSRPIDVSSLSNGIHLITVGNETFKVMVEN